jgi:hypothetical protein
MSVETTNDFAEFLISRRAKITPEHAGLPTYGKRRVPGLRREEVASQQALNLLAGWTATPDPADIAGG